MIELWKETPGFCEETPYLSYYKPASPAGKGAVIILPGGGYAVRTPYEGVGYAEFLAEAGIHAFVLEYRVAPHYYPLPLIDARRAVRYVRAHAEKYGIDKDKVAIMGSSAGGHLAAIISTFTDALPYENMDDIDKEDGLPDAQILCYPVICTPSSCSYAHEGSFQCLLGEHGVDEEQKVDPLQHIKKNTPSAFIWHTFDDDCVDVRNSLMYASALRQAGVDTELHIFPHGPHGMGAAPDNPHVHQWVSLLLKWLQLKEWI